MDVTLRSPSKGRKMATVVESPRVTKFTPSKAARSSPSSSGKKARNSPKNSPAKVMRLKAIKLGSVCAGLDVGSMIMKRLLPDHPVKHVFGCDTRPESKVWVQENFPVQRWFNDVTSTEFKKEAEYVDVFTAGFPC